MRAYELIKISSYQEVADWQIRNCSVYKSNLPVSEQRCLVLLTGLVVLFGPILTFSLLTCTIEGAALFIPDNGSIIMHVSRDLGVHNESNISTTYGSLMNVRAIVAIVRINYLNKLTINGTESI